MKCLTFIVSDKCNITCDLCAPGCGPHNKEYLTAQIMKNLFDRVSDLGPVPLVVFTGGEPLLFKKEVEETIRHISISSDTQIRIVTNAYWATSPDSARSMLRSLKEAGLTELNCSVDDFHQKYIPEEFIRNAIDAALELEVPVLLAHKTFPGSKSNRYTY